MNDMSPWEKQLESWTPRPPSARLKQRLFGAERDAAPARSMRSPVLWAWLAPATCLLVLATSVSVVLVRSDRPGYLSAVSSSNMIASLMAPRTLMDDYSPDTRAQENIWAVATSDRGVGHSLTATSSFALWKTNAHF